MLICPVGLNSNIGFATPKKIIIKSDGRVVDDSEKMVLDEHYNKTKRLSDTVICGYTGNKSICELIIENLNTLAGNNLQEYNADDVVDLLHNIASSFAEQYPEYTVSFLVGGLNESGTATLNSFITTERHITYNRSSATEYAVTSLDPPHQHGMGCKIYKKYCKLGKDPISAIDLCIKEMSRRDFTVNNVIYQRTLSL